jgi:hypothetical protein
MAKKVQEHAIEEFEDAQHQRGRIQDEMDDIRQVLEHIREMHRPEKGIDSFPAVTEVKARVASSEKDTIQTIA